MHPMGLQLWDIGNNGAKLMSIWETEEWQERNH